VKSLPVSPEVQAYIRAVSVALFSVVAAALGILAVGAFGDYFKAYPVYAPLILTKSLGVDILGALIPLAVVLLSVAAFIKFAKSPVKKLAVALAISALLAFGLCHQTADGVAGYPLLYAFLVSIVSAGVNLYPKPNIGFRALAASLALTVFCVPLSLFAVDLAYSPNYYGAVIGGNGLTDGLLMSTLYAPLAVAIVFSAITYVSVTFNLVKISQNASNIKSLKKIRTVASDNPTSQAYAE
jgi:hypothetical protein